MGLKELKKLSATEHIKAIQWYLKKKEQRDIAAMMKQNDAKNQKFIMAEVRR